jgi:hypothetical protein
MRWLVTLTVALVVAGCGDSGGKMPEGYYTPPGRDPVYFGRTTVAKVPNGTLFFAPREALAVDSSRQTWINLGAPALDIKEEEKLNGWDRDRHLYVDKDESGRYWVSVSSAGYTHWAIASTLPEGDWRQVSRVTEFKAAPPIRP